MTRIQLLCSVFLGAMAAQNGFGVTISVTADPGNSSTAFYNSAVGNLLTDPFLYNSVVPTATSPDRNWNGGSNAYHANEPEGVDVLVSFTLNTPFTVTDSELVPVVDMWGRNDCCQQRDNNVDVIICNGDYSNVVAIVTGIVVPDAAPQHARAVFDGLDVGVVFDRFQIIGHDTDPAAGNPFTLFEVRLALASPYTYAWTGDAGDGDWTNTVNWLGGQVPVDNLAGTGWNAGLTMLRQKSIGFVGDNLPTNNFPGIGGTTGGGDSPTMKFNSVGTTVFKVFSREAGLWTDSVSAYNELMVIGDGIGGGTEDVTLILTNLTGTLNRHIDGTHNIKVNSDGTLIFSERIDFAYNSVRPTVLTINDGDIIVNGYVEDLDNIAACLVEFTSTGGTFTAKYGSDYDTINKVKSRLEKDFVPGPDNPNIHFKAKDNGNSTFTVTPGIYCWTGEANDGDWNNAANWAYGRIPVDNAPGTGNLDGLTLSFTEFIVFDGTNMPTLNVPQFGGDHLSAAGQPEKDTPTLKLKRGGKLIMSVTGREDGFWTNTQINRTVLAVGDGIGGGIEDVTLVITNMTGSFNRHYGAITHTLEVNSDGTLIVEGEADFAFVEATDRWSRIVINGGKVIVNGVLDDLLLHVNNKVEFNAVEGTLTAQYGGDFADIDAVRDALGTEFIDNIGPPEGMRFVAVNNGNGTFTVLYEMIPPAGTLFMLQ